MTKTREREKDRKVNYAKNQRLVNSKEKKKLENMKREEISRFKTNETKWQRERKRKKHVNLILEWSLFRLFIEWIVDLSWEALTLMRTNDDVMWSQFFSFIQNNLQFIYLYRVCRCACLTSSKEVNDIEIANFFSHCLHFVVSSLLENSKKHTLAGCINNMSVNKSSWMENIMR